MQYQRSYINLNLSNSGQNNCEQLMQQWLLENCEECFRKKKEIEKKTRVKLEMCVKQQVSVLLIHTRQEFDLLLDPNVENEYTCLLRTPTRNGINCELI